MMNNSPMELYTRISDLEALCAAKTEQNNRQKDRIAELEAQLTSRDQQMRRWNYVRDKLVWADCRDGNVRWVMYMEMPVPDISAKNLTATSVKEELDTAIDEAL